MVFLVGEYMKLLQKHIHVSSIILICCLGGGLIPESTTVEPLHTGTLPLNYSDIAKIREHIVQSVTASLQKELSTFKMSFRAELESQVDKHIEQVCLSH